jgi:hypothetical protein
VLTRSGRQVEISQQIVESRCTCASSSAAAHERHTKASTPLRHSLKLPLQTYALRECMLKHREYYAPVLEEEVSVYP